MKKRRCRGRLADREQLHVDIPAARALNVSKLVVSKTPADAITPAALRLTVRNVKASMLPLPVFKFSETHIFSPGTITTQFKKNIAEMTGRMNSMLFRGYEPGEVLFLGASGQRQGDDPEDMWSITYNFAVSLNQSYIAIGDLTVSYKRGWDYLWAQYKPADVTHGTVKRIVNKPIAAFVERVYD